MNKVYIGITVDKITNSHSFNFPKEMDKFSLKDNEIFDVFILLQIELKGHFIIKVELEEDSMDLIMEIDSMERLNSVLKRLQLL